MILVNPEKRMVTIKVPGTTECITIKPEGQSDPVDDKHLRVLRPYIDQFNLKVVQESEESSNQNENQNQAKEEQKEPESKKEEPKEPVVRKRTTKGKDQK